MNVGLTAEGFRAKTLTDIKAELEAEFQASFGASIDLSSSTVIGQLIGVMSERFAELWEVSQAVYSAFDPDQAEDAALEALCALTGTLRRPARPSRVTAIVTGTLHTILPEGRVASVQGTGARFRTVEEVTLATATLWTPNTAFQAGDIVSNGGSMYQALLGGISGNSGGPVDTIPQEVDGTVTWFFLGKGDAAASVSFESEELAPIVALSNTLDSIETPVAGWQGVRNVLDAELGALLETDASLRLRRENELVRGASATIEAIRTDILTVEGVIAATVFENTTDSVDVNGLPAHSVEILVQGGDDQAVRDAIFATMPAGIETHGDVSGTVEDSQGESHTVRFSRPEPIEVIVTIELDKDPSGYPLDGDEQVKQAIVAFGNTFSAGKDVFDSAMSAQAFRVPGVLDVTSVLLSRTGNPSQGTRIVVTNRQIAVFDTSRVNVTSSDGTP